MHWLYYQVLRMSDDHQEMPSICQCQPMPNLVSAAPQTELMGEN